MRIILWIGNEPNQKALANKIHSLFPLAGIVTETRARKRKITLSKILSRLFLSSIGKAWWNMQQYYCKHFPDYPNVRTIDVENINSDKVYEFSKDADLIIVSGTRMIKEKLLSLKPKIGILNLHTGLSPYVKGGPNCTNWCIANGEFHFIGNTIMWIDAGIDSGNILTTEFTPLSGEETLEQVHLNVMEHAHALYLKAITYVLEGKTNSVPQHSIAKGNTYYTKDWNLSKQFDLSSNLKKIRSEVNSGELEKKRKDVKTISL
jgi:folate-dependent phosphoribosylglycinamide formyltransferase PurN